MFCLWLCLVLFLSALTGCSPQMIRVTGVYFDTVVQISADVPSDVLDGALELCRYYDELWDARSPKSDLFRINHSDSPVSVQPETLTLMRDAVEVCRNSDGRFDITMASVSFLYDFQSEELPEETAISDALSRVDYRRIQIGEDSVCANGTSVDFGGIAKGYITDRLASYLKENGATRAVINLGGNVLTFGKKDARVGIAKPFSSEICVTVEQTDGLSLVTSGIYQRYIEKDGRIYHHILDPKTGYGAENDLASATVISACSETADALSTTCMLLGSGSALEKINLLDGVECVLILRDGSVRLSNGLTQKGGRIFLSQKKTK